MAAALPPKSRPMKHLLAFLALIFAAMPTARALDITCIEASKYKHLFLIFGKDPNAFASYLELDPARLPEPGMCRAALITGSLEHSPSTELRKVAEFILANKGWLASLHLSSSGGSITTGLQIGMLTRAMWLKTSTARSPGGRFFYTPDFFVPPIDPPGRPAVASNEPAATPGARLADGWKLYQAEIQKLEPARSGSTCASACTFIQAAGIERLGIASVHRGRYAGQDSFVNQNVSMQNTNEGLMRTEAIITAFYNSMDAGAEFIRRYQATAAQTTTPVEINRHPRYVADYLLARCKMDAAQLQRLELQLIDTMNNFNNPNFGLVYRPEKLRQSLSIIREQRSKAEQCVAAAHEKERLAAFDKLCKRNCTADDLMKFASDRVRDLARTER